MDVVGAREVGNANVDKDGAVAEQRLEIFASFASGAKTSGAESFYVDSIEINSTESGGRPDK